MNRQEFEAALDAGCIRVRMPNGRLWLCRRNGKTQVWKTRPNEFRIPIKYGFRSFGAVTHDNIESEELVIVD